MIDLLVAEGEHVVALMTITRTLHEELRAFGLTFPARGSAHLVDMTLKQDRAIIRR